MQTQENIEPADTRHRLMDAAAEVFLEKGYRAATVRDICQRAGTNIASVNYHFGDKASLYRELIVDYPLRSLEKRPRGTWMREGMTPDELLFGFVHDFLMRVLSPDRPAWHAILMTRETSDPSEIFPEIADGFIKPQVEALGRIILAVAGKPLPPDVVGRCTESIIPQIVFQVTGQAVIKHLHPERVNDAASIEALARHISSFCAAGIRAIAAEVKP